MFRRSAVMLVAIVIVGCIGRYGYFALVTVDIEGDATRTVEKDHVDDLVHEAAAWLSELGFGPSDLLPVAQGNDIRLDHEFRTVALFASHEWASRDVLIWIGVADQPLRVRFTIRDMGVPWESEKVKQLRARIEAELATRFGKDRIRTEQGKRGPVIFAG